MAKGKKQELNIKEFEIFKIKLGKYIASTRPPGKTKPEAALELNTSLSKYNAYEDPTTEYGRQTIPFDLLFRIAKRDRLSLSELIDKINKIDNRPSQLNKSSTDKVIEELSDKILKSSRSNHLFTLYNCFLKKQSEFPKEYTINLDPELWIISLLKNILILDNEDIVELIYSIIKKINQKKNFGEINKNLDLSYNEILIKHAINQFILFKKKEFQENN